MTRKTPGKVPSFEEIASLLAENLDDESRAEEIRDYLADDPELARAALDATDPSRLAAIANLSTEEVDQAWVRFKSGLGHLVYSPPDLEKPRGWRLGRLAGARPFWAMAATFLLGFCLAGALFYRREAPVLPGNGRGQVLIERLDRVIDTNLERGEKKRLEAGKEIESLVLLLSPPPDLSGEIPSTVHYMVSRGQEVSASGELQQQDEGFFALLLPSASLSPGDYWIRLFRPGEKEAFAKYRFTFAPKAGK
jgi:hypothetical protein